MRKVHFSTPAQVLDYCIKTLAIIEDADVPEGLREVAFTAVFTQIAGAQVFMDQSDASGPVLPARAIPQNKGH